MTEDTYNLDVDVRVANCHTGGLGSDPGVVPKIISTWNYFTGGSGISGCLSRPLGAVAGYT